MQHAVVSHDEWLSARRNPLKAEKEPTHLRDKITREWKSARLSAGRRREQWPEAAVTQRGRMEAAVIHHVFVGTNEVGRSKRFYDAVLPIVGILPMAEDEGGLGYGCGTFHFSVQIPIDGKPATVDNGTHIAFAVDDRSMVDRFYAAAMANRGCVRTTMPTIMRRSSATRTVTRSRP